MIPTRLSLAVGLCAALTPSFLSSQHVLVVDDDGGAGIAFVNIQAAVDAAVDGDTVLVRSGSYGGVFVEGKSVSIVADRGAAVQLDGSVQIRDLGPGHNVFVHGVTAQAIGGPALEVENCAGPVLVSDSQFRGPLLIAHFAISPGASITRSSAVTLARSSVQGGAGLSYPISVSSDALSVAESAVQLFDTHLVGGGGALGTTGADPATGGAGLQIRNGFVHVHGGSVTGGHGGFAPLTLLGCRNGGTGGTGAVLSGTGTLVDVQGATVSGGVGGGTTVPCDRGVAGAAAELRGGLLVPLAGTARQLSINQPLRERKTLAFEIEASAGDLAAVAVSKGLADTPLRLPFPSGPLLVESVGAELVPIGLVPGSGILQGAFPLRNLAPGVSIATWFAQVVTVDAQLRVFVGNPQAIVILDAAF